ncbi:hypothetical protein LEMLEM_LOCUS9576 [Lemmus lemmus]
MHPALQGGRGPERKERQACGLEALPNASGSWDVEFSAGVADCPSLKESGGKQTGLGLPYLGPPTTPPSLSRAASPSETLLQNSTPTPNTLSKGLISSKDPGNGGRARTSQGASWGPEGIFSSPRGCIGSSSSNCRVGEDTCSKLLLGFLKAGTCSAVQGVDLQEDGRDFTTGKSLPPHPKLTLPLMHLLLLPFLLG